MLLIVSLCVSLRSHVRPLTHTLGSHQIHHTSHTTHHTGSSESPEFDLCGHVWQLRIFPGGSLEAHKGHLSFYLASKSSRQARASYKLSVLCQHSAISPSGSAAGDTRSVWNGPAISPIPIPIDPNADSNSNPNANPPRLAADSNEPAAGKFRNTSYRAMGAISLYWWWVSCSM